MGIFSDVLLVSDYDNTLTGPGGLPDAQGRIQSRVGIPQANLDAIAAFEKEGGLFTLASGRPQVYFKNVILPNVQPSAPVILTNGAHIWDSKTGEDVRVQTLPETTRGYLRDVIRRFPAIGVEAQRPRDISILYCPKEQEEYFRGVEFQVPATLETYPDPWVKLCLMSNHEVVHALWQYTQENYPELESVESVPTNCEVQARGVTKGSSARWLAKELGRSILVCVGDAPNDLSMLEEADYAFVTESGFPEMQTMGFISCAPSRKGAVADVIRQLRTIL